MKCWGLLGCDGEFANHWCDHQRATLRDDFERNRICRICNLNVACVSTVKVVARGRFATKTEDSIIEPGPPKDNRHEKDQTRE